jgi:uncharacterized YigZ family protein
MTEGYFIPGRAVRHEYQVSNSRFIADARPVRDAAAARAEIAAIRAEFPDANHHCYAYLIGYGSSTQAGMSDDGEPSGTAGRPMMAVLRGAELGDVVVVVTRYFGGTLLGTGGLVRAYSDGVRLVLAQVPRVLRQAWREVRAALSYADDGGVRRLLAAAGAELTDEAYGADVVLSFRIVEREADVLLAQLRDATAARLQVLEQRTVL